LKLQYQISLNPLLHSLELPVVLRLDSDFRSCSLGIRTHVLDRRKWPLKLK